MITVTVSSFLERFPEFTAVNEDFPTLIQLVIDEAILQVSLAVWGDKADLGVLYLTAHLLAISPYGEPSRLAPGTGDTIYLHTFKTLQKEVTSGYRVVGRIQIPRGNCCWWYYGY